MKKTRVSELEFDPKLLELRPVNLYYVSRYRQAMRTGAQFPPPIVDENNRIVSGNTRVTAYRQEYGDDHEIEVVVEKFPDEAAVIRRFAEENSRHGNPLSGISQKAIIQTLLKHGDTIETVAATLNIPPNRIKSLGGMSVIVMGRGKKREMRPFKHGLEHMSGQTMQRKQYEEHRQADRGIPAATLARQLQRWIDHGWIDMESQSTLEALDDLYAALGRLIEARKVA